LWRFALGDFPSSWVRYGTRGTRISISFSTQALFRPLVWPPLSDLAVSLLVFPFFPTLTRHVRPDPTFRFPQLLVFLSPGLCYDYALGFFAARTLSFDFNGDGERAGVQYRFLKACRSLGKVLSLFLYVVFFVLDLPFINVQIPTPLSPPGSPTASFALSPRRPV